MGHLAFLSVETLDFRRGPERSKLGSGAEALEGVNTMRIFRCFAATAAAFAFAAACTPQTSDYGFGRIINEDRLVRTTSDRLWYSITQTRGMPDIQAKIEAVYDLGLFDQTYTFWGESVTGDEPTKTWTLGNGTPFTVKEWRLYTCIKGTDDCSFADKWPD